MSFDTKIITGTEQQKKRLKEVRLREMKRMRRLNTFAGKIQQLFGEGEKSVLFGALLPKSMVLQKNSRRRVDFAAKVSVQVTAAKSLHAFDIIAKFCFKKWRA